MVCACQSDDLPLQDGFLLVWTPTPHAESKLVRFCQGAGVLCQSDKNLKCLRLEVDDFAKLAVGLTGSLSWQEIHDSKALRISRECGVPRVEHLGRVETLERFIADTRVFWVQQLFQNSLVKIYWQPIHDVKSGEVFGLEGLVRGFETDGSMLMPQSIFGASRESSYLFNLDRRCRILAVESAYDAQIFQRRRRAFINFDPASIYDPNFCLRTTVSKIETLGVSPDQIVFEVTESSQYDNIQHLAGILKYYKRAGFSVALDDFGSGNNNLQQFIKLEPDYIKIDKILIEDIDTDDWKCRTVERLVAMAKDSGCKVIVEGIETIGQYEAIRNIGADFAQGYLFGRPAPVGQFERFV